MYDENNIIVTKIRNFAIRIVRLSQYLQSSKKEFVITKQLLKSGTSIGANVKEAVRGQSKSDFAAKMNIALKESSETEYWIDILHETDYITDKEFISINNDLNEISRLLMSIVKTSLKG